MLSVDSKLFKQVAEKFANEIIEKYCPDTKVKHSFVLEALSHAFGYKDYNTIKPQLDSQNVLLHQNRQNKDYSFISSKEMLLNEGFIDCWSEPFLLSETETSHRSILKHYHFEQLFFFLKKLQNNRIKYFIEIEPKEFSEEESDMIVASIYANKILFGMDIHYFKGKDFTFYVFWDNQELQPSHHNSPNQNEDESVFVKEGSILKVLSTYSNKIPSRDYYVVEKIEGQIMFLSSRDNVNIKVPLYKKEYIVCKDIQEALATTRLHRGSTPIVDNFHLFSDDYNGLLKSKFILREHPDVADFLLRAVLGYAVEHK